MILGIVYSAANALYSAFNLWTVVVLCAALAWQWWRKPHPNFPPGKRGFPILGVLPYLGEYPQKVLSKWAREYGPVMSVRMGGRDVVVLNTVDAINQALIKKASAFSGRAQMELVTQILGNNGLGFCQYDENFKSQKKFALHTIKNFGMGKKAMENAINEETEYFVNYLSTKVGKPIYLGLDISNIISNIICKISFGKRFDYDDSTFRKMLKILQNQYNDPKYATQIAALTFYYKYLHRIPPFSTANQMFVRGEYNFMDIFQPIIDQHRKSFDPNCCRDYIDAFLNKQKIGNDPSFTDKQLLISVRDLFVGGTEPTSTTLLWSFTCLVYFPEHYKKIMKEIDSVFGEEDKPSMAKTVEMPFTCAFLEEVWRLFPIAPLSLMHETLHDTELFGYNIQKGTHVIPCIYAAHLDPNVWSDPEKFEPLRHINEKGKFSASGKVMSFGVGPRLCPGEGLARVETRLIFISVLQKFHITAESHELPKLGNGSTSIVYSPAKFKMILNFR